MKILKLSLRNFKGVRNFTLDTQGGNVEVFGDNATGKTTIADAFSWLLFDKDSQNKAIFDIKTLDENNQPILGLEHEVEAVLEVGGKQLTLRKVYKEKMTKKRGSATAEFTGHTTDYYIDGVPAKKKEYVDKVAEIASEDVFKLLTSPAYFNKQLHWQERRKILLQVCGDISDQEVIASDKSLAELPEILQGRKLEDHRKVIVARRAEINKELERIPVRIDEVQRNLPDISTITPSALDSDMEKLRAKRQKKEQELSRIQSGGEIAEKRLQLREIEAELLQLKNEHQAQITDMVGGKQRELTRLKGQALELNGTVSRLKRQKEDCLASIAQLEEQNAKLRERWYQVNKRKFEFEEQEDTCPYCEQALPAEKLEAARGKALSDFNRKKAEELQAISEAGKRNSARTVELRGEVAKLDKEIEQATIDVANCEKLAGDLQKEVDALLAGVTDVTETPAYTEKLKEKEVLERAIIALQRDNAEAIAEVKADITVIDQDIEKLEEAAAKIKQYELGTQRIEELKAQERELAAEFEKLEKELYLSEQFVRSKVALLEEKINSKFKLARFKLFDVQVNGGVVECCETLYNGVPYSTGLNNAARINVGLDIIRTLAKHYDFYPPIFIDNREAITSLIDMGDQQIISLIVSEKDKKLRVELEEPKGTGLFKEVV